MIDTHSHLFAEETLNCVLDKMDLDWIPIEKSWRLNEKHYGSLRHRSFQPQQKYLFAIWN